MASKNDVTGDSISSKLTTDLFRDNWDKIFKQKEKQMETAVEIIKIPKEEYEILRDRAYILGCLENAGVDNWDGYSDAMDLYHGEEE